MRYTEKTEQGMRPFLYSSEYYDWRNSIGKGKRDVDDAGDHHLAKQCPGHFARVKEDRRVAARRLWS